ncbi:MAG: hypothetical protein WCC27_17290 [Acidobacteriaceae bacterium]
MNANAVVNPLSPSTRRSVSAPHSIHQFFFAALACLGLLAFASTSRAAGPVTARKPLGVYVHLDIEDAQSRYPGPGTSTPAEMHRYLRGLYAGLLSDRAISGITAGMHWDHIQLAGPLCAFSRSCPAGTVDGYDWSYLDDVFAEASAAHKTVQLLITPGADSPPWLMDAIPSCDGLFSAAATAPPDCGKVTFANFPEEGHTDSAIQPLPWNLLYVAAWDDFLLHLSARYNANPAFVYVAMAGPVCGSTEIIFPTTANGSTTQVGAVPADDAWAALIQHSFPHVAAYQNSDQVFIDTWKQTIDAYEAVFSGITLILSPDAGNALPEFTGPVTVHPDNTLFAVDCSAAPGEQRSCEAKTEILSYLVAAKGPNAKGSNVGGLTAAESVTTGDIGISGVKVLTVLPSPLLGGAEFDYPVSTPGTLQHQGCPNYPANCANLTPEEATWYTLATFFSGTPAAADFGAASGPAPVQFIEPDYLDLIYAQDNPCAAPGSTIPGNPSIQDLYSKASYDLFQMAGRPASLRPPTCP